MFPHVACRSTPCSRRQSILLPTSAECVTMLSDKASRNSYCGNSPVLYLLWSDLSEGCQHPDSGASWVSEPPSFTNALLIDTALIQLRRRPLVYHPLG